MPIFSVRELDRRVRAFSQALSERELDAALLTTSDNVYYLSGMPLLSEWGRPLYLALAPDGHGRLIGAMLEKESMEHYSHIEVEPYDDQGNVWHTSLEIAVQFIKSASSSPRRIGVERPFLTNRSFRALQDAFPDASLVDVSDVVFDLRLVKSDEEIELLTLGGEIAQLGAKVFFNSLREGVAELEVVANAVGEMNRALADRHPEGATSTYAYCQIGSHTLTPHMHATGRRLRRGDVVGLNVFPVIWGYCTELERTIIFGDPSEGQHRAMTAVNEAHVAASDAVAPGVAMKDVDVLSRSILEGHGYGRFIRHGTGHALGIMIGMANREEQGEVRSYNAREFAKNMVTSIEPGVYVPNLGGFRHSDVLVLTDSGTSSTTVFPIGDPVLLAS